jgi:hypothetical protein
MFLLSLLKPDQRYINRVTWLQDFGAVSASLMMLKNYF